MGIILNFSGQKDAYMGEVLYTVVRVNGIQDFFVLKGGGLW